MWKKKIALALFSGFGFFAHANETLLRQEWIETNGLGSVISGGVGLANLRNYHAHYVVVNSRGDRVTLVNNLEAWVNDGSQSIPLSSNYYAATNIYPRGDENIISFQDRPYPQWKFKINAKTWIQKEILFVKKSNRVLIRYSTNSNSPLTLTVRPLLSGRSYFGIRKSYEGLNPTPLREENGSLIFSLENALPFFTMEHNGVWKNNALTFWNQYYPLTAVRLEDPWENLWSPGESSFSVDSNHSAQIQFHLEAEQASDFSELWSKEVASREALLSQIQTDNSTIQSLAYHSEDYLFTRMDGKKSILAGFPWFFDWGRDTFISLEGLVLIKGRADQAYEILRHFAHYEKDGLLPNWFPNLGGSAAYNSVDAPMWFLRMAFKTLEAGANEERFKQEIWPSLQSIITHFIEGTSYNIKVDPKDGLVFAGEEGQQLTWMDAKIDNEVITARMGKPVEINALWYANLKDAISYAQKRKLPIPTAWTKSLELIKANFAPRFYHKEEGMIRDVVDAIDLKDETRLRPNGLFALVLAKDLFKKEDALRALNRIEAELWTPMGLRSLTPKDPAYAPRYEGDGRARDRIYHQGTVWPFLVGIYNDALLIWKPELKPLELWKKYEALAQTSDRYSPGHVAEIFDGSAPQRPQGCYAQAWSDAELLRIAYNLGLLKFQNK